MILSRIESNNCLVFGSVSTSGLPASPPSRIFVLNGIFARSGTSAPTSSLNRLAVSSPPPLPKIEIFSPVVSEIVYDIFSITPITGCFI